MGRDRKAQIQMTETVAILFIFFVLLTFGIVFYYQFQKSSLQNKQEEIFQRQAIEKTTQVLFLPELSCTKGEGESEDFCFDILKLNQAEELLKIDYYYQIFGFATITVEQVFPDEQDFSGDESSSPKIWPVYDREKKDAEGNVIWERKEETRFVVTLKDESQGKAEYKVGVVTVGVYQ